MNDVVRRRLCEALLHLNTQADETINHKKVKGLLLDLCGEYRTEINILVLAVAEGYVKSLADTPATPAAHRIKSAAAHFSRDFALSEAVASWAINSWALALRIIDTEIPPDPPLASSPPSPNTKQLNLRIKAPAKTGAVPASPPQNWPTPTVVVSRFGYGDYKSLDEAISNNQGDVSILVKKGTYMFNPNFYSAALGRSVYVIADSAAGDVVLENGSVDLVRSTRLGISQCTLRNVSFGSLYCGSGHGVLCLSSCRGIDSHFTGLKMVDLMDCSFDGDLVLHVNKARVHHGTIMGACLRVRFDESMETESLHSVEFSACTIKPKSLVLEGDSCRVLVESSQIESPNGTITFNGSQVFLQDCSISCPDEGVAVTNDCCLTLTRCRLSSALSQRSARLVKISGYGVVKSTESEFFGSRTGVDVQVGTAEMQGCRFYDNDVGIRFASESAGKVENCDLQSNGVPLDVDAAADVELVNNLV